MVSFMLISESPFKVTNHMLRVADLDIVINLNVARSDCTLAFLDSESALLLPCRSSRGQRPSGSSRISITSSCTPSIALYSCNTPSISTSVMAQPGMEDSRIRRKAFPRVWPKPRSRGSRVTWARVLCLFINIDYTRGQKFVHCTLHFGTCNVRLILMVDYLE